MCSSAQGICLEEMFGVGVPAGAVYHASSRRRRGVPFTAELRELTLRTTEELRDLLSGTTVPAAELRPQCEGCSLHAVCLPELTQSAGSLDRHWAALFARDPPGVREPPNPFA